MESSNCDKIIINLERSINGLQSTDKSIVKQSIAEIINVVDSRTDPSERLALYDQLEKPLINCLQCSVESCREKSIKLITSFINDFDVDRKYLVLLIPAIYNRIGTDDLLENSEEIRVQILNLLQVIIEKYSDCVGPYVEDIVAILSRGIKDSAPLVKRSSCQCAISLSSLAPREFYTFTKNVIEPLRESITHQHWRVRVAVIEAIGSVLQYGDGKLLAPETSNALAKRLFDDTPNVRLAVVKIVGQWLLKMTDRYSYFPHLLPHILTSLSDSNEEVRQTAAKYWLLIGDQFLNENEKDFKDEIDLGHPELEHYPPDVVRPSLGCRCLVQREAYKFLPAISAELSDWLAHVKIKSAQLLSQVILHSESKITQHVNKIIQAMCKSAADPQQEITYYVKLSAMYMGYFVPVEVYIKLITDHISDTPSCGELETVAALISGSQSSQLVPHLTSLLHLISNSTTKEGEQRGMNNVIKSIMTVCKTECFSIGNELWAAIVTNFSLADSQNVLCQSKDLLHHFINLHEDKSKEEVNKLYSKYLLDKLRATSIWTVHCHDQFIFTGAISIAGEIIEEHTDDILAILKKSTSDDSDAEVVLKIILACHEILQKHDVTLPNEGLVKTFVNRFIEDVLLSRLVWKPGRSAEALRSGATLTLLTAISLHVPDDIGSILPVVLSLVEDAAPRTRLLALKSLTKLSTALSHDMDEFSKTVQVILKRLDDCDKSVREMSIKTIKAFFSVLVCQDKHRLFSKTILEFIYNTMLIHLDDQDKSIQLLVLDCLTLLADCQVELLQNKLKHETFRDKNIQEELMKILEEKISNNKINNLEQQMENISVKT